MSTKVNIKLRGETVPIDKEILDIFTVARYGERYESDEVKKKVREDLRDLIGTGEKPPHPLEVYRVIIVSLLPVSKQKLLAKNSG